ncbi:MAG: glycosyltransferase family 2 protein [Lachnospiraceae bacterium]|nr:glycosyltransferase family 2 protein [Lachnospiraceae bacterium]
MVKVSIIVPVYNKEKYLDRCLTTIINQTYKNIEVICVNDGSTDRSLEILSKFAEEDKRINIINECRKGAGHARNIGLLNARGKYVQFLDADDFFELDMVENLVMKAEGLCTDIVICDALIYDEKEKIYKCGNWININNVKKDPFCSEDVENILEITASCVWNKLYRLDFLIENNCLFQEIENNNDTYFAIWTVFLAERISYVDRVFIYYREYYEENRISSNRGRQVECCAIAYKKLISAMKKKKIYKRNKEILNKQMEKAVLYELSFCKDIKYGKKLISSFIKILQEPEKIKIKYFYEGFQNYRTFYLFGFLPLVKSINLERKKIFIVLNCISFDVKK